MDQTDAKKLVKEIVENNITLTRINAYLKKHNSIKTKSDGVIFLKEYSKISPYHWHYISEEFLKYSNHTKKYSQFVVYLIKNDNVFVAPKLMGIYKKDPILFEMLYEEFLQIDDIDVAAALGILLAGMNNTDPDRLFGTMLTDKRICHPEIVLLHTVIGSKCKIPRNVFLSVLKYAESGDKKIREMAIFVLMTKFTEDSLTARKLLKLVQSSDQARDQIVNNLTSHISDKNPLLYLNLLKICANVGSKILRNKAMINMQFVFPYHPVECLIQLQKWLKEAEYGDARNVVNDWPLEKSIKRENVTKVEDFLLSWIGKNPTYSEFILPNIIAAVYRNDPDQILLLLKRAPCKTKRESDLVVETLKEFLLNTCDEFHDEFALDDTHKSIFPNAAKKKLFLNNVKKILIDKAGKQGVDTTVDTTVHEGLKDPYMQNMVLLHNIHIRKKIIDPNVVKKALVDYPDIVEFIGKDKVDKLIGNCEHPLVMLLSRVNVPKKVIAQYENAFKVVDSTSKLEVQQWLLNQYWPRSLLTDLNESLKNLGNVKSREIRAMLKKSDKFDSAFMQLNVYFRLKQSFSNVELEPRVTPSVLDVAAEINKKKYYFEIYTPHEDIKVKYIPTVHMIKTERTKFKVIDKLEKQIRSAYLNDAPMIVIIDNENVAFDEYDVGNMMYGTPEIAIGWDTSAGKAVRERIKRRKDSFGEKYKYGSIISAIMIVRRYVDNRDMKVKIRGSIIPHMYARFPLDKNTIKEIKYSLLNNAVDWHAIKTRS